MVNRRNYNHVETQKLETILELEQERIHFWATQSGLQSCRSKTKKLTTISSKIHELNPLRGKDITSDNEYRYDSIYSEHIDGSGYKRVLPLKSEDAKLVNLVERCIIFENTFLQLRVSKLREEVNYVIFFELLNPDIGYLTSRMQDEYKSTEYSNAFMQELGLDRISERLPEEIRIKYRFKDCTLSPEAVYGEQGEAQWFLDYRYLAVKLSFEDKEKKRLVLDHNIAVKKAELEKAELEKAEYL